MIYTELTKKAMRICYDAHGKQNDKGGLPYVFHPLILAQQMETEEETCTALLHDVIEDTEWTLEGLEAEGFPPPVVEALGLLTHERGLSYLDYVEKIRHNPTAAKVKLADLRHNSTVGRLEKMTDRTIARLCKYLRAQAVLTGGEADLDGMCLKVTRLLRTDGGRKAYLQITYEPDGRIRSFGLIEKAAGRETEEREPEEEIYTDRTSLLKALETKKWPISEILELLQEE